MKNLCRGVVFDDMVCADTQILNFVIKYLRENENNYETFVAYS